MLHELRKGETVEHALCGHSALARHLDAPRSISLRVECAPGLTLIGASKLKRALVPAPVKVKTPGIGVDLHGDAMRGADSQNFFDIHGLAFGLKLEAGLCTLATTKSKRSSTSSG